MIQRVMAVTECPVICEPENETNWRDDPARKVSRRRWEIGLCGSQACLRLRKQFEFASVKGPEGILLQLTKLYQIAGFRMEEKLRGIAVEHHAGRSSDRSVHGRGAAILLHQRLASVRIQVLHNQVDGSRLRLAGDGNGQTPPPSAWL